MNGCLLIHGFTGDPNEILPLAEHIRQHIGWYVYTPTLPGHGEHESLHSVTWEDWVTWAEVKYKEISAQCEGDIYVIGFSMGGMLAAHLASKYPIKKVVLLSAAVYSPNHTQFIKNVGQELKDQLFGLRSLSTTFKRYKRKVKDTPVKAVLHFKRLIKELTPSFDHITVPILIVQGEKDDLVAPRSAHYIYEHVRSKRKRILYLKESKHVLCHDCEAEELIREVDQFLIEDV